jgi:hypothetical protein
MRITKVYTEEFALLRRRKRFQPVAPGLNDLSSCRAAFCEVGEKGLNNWHHRAQAAFAQAQLPSLRPYSECADFANRCLGLHILSVQPEALESTPLSIYRHLAEFSAAD